MKKSFKDLIPKDLDVCLLGLQGSRGQGLQEEKDADYDYRGVFVEKNSKFLSLYDLPRETIETGKGAQDDEAEFVFHELNKFVRLAVKGNPSVLLLFFVPKWDIKTNIGNSLLANRNLFLSDKPIRDAFGGYALSQVLRLKRFGKFQNGKKRRKHIKHCFRLLIQGTELLETGNITMPMTKKNRNYVLEVAERADDLDYILDKFHERDAIFKEAKSVFPETIDKELVDKFILSLRENNK